MKLPENYVLGMGVVKPTAKGGFGQKMLEKLGWREGEGLGKNKTGIVEAISVKKKIDKDGVGAKKGFDWSTPFWENAYESALQNVKLGGSKSASSSGDSVSSEDEESSRVSTEEPRKGRRKRKGMMARNHDGTVSSAQTSELEMFDFLLKGRTGRWGGRSAKLARIQEQEKALADSARKKLGLVVCQELPSDDGLEQKMKKKKKKRLQGGAEEEEKLGENTKARKDRKPGKEKKKKKIRKLKEEHENPKEKVSDPNAELENGPIDGKAQKTKKPQRGRVGVGQKIGYASTEGGDSEAKSSFSTKTRLSIDRSERKRCKKAKHQDSFSEVVYPDPTPASGWWGANRFVSSGFAGQVKEVVSLDVLERQTFDEDDQERVYMFAHNSKRKGKVGLGH